MERESNPMQALCRSGCGFYGSPATDGLCSLCYKEALKKKQQPPVSAPSPASSVSAAQTLSSFMETAQTTVPCLQSPVSIVSTPALTDSSSNIDSMSQSHIPIDQQPCENQQSSQNGSESGRSSSSRELVPVPEEIHETITTNAIAAETEARNEAQLSQKTIEDTASANTSTDVGANSSGNSDKDADKDARKKKNRCATCRKKVGLTGFECRCGGLFCAVHRYSDKHDCSFNYREMGAQEIRRNNPVVVGEKIQKI